ncbi:hypothetical protein DNJ95_08615 [Stutzerimonas kirkiae]|uniref:Glycosyltransferase 2-like domain-containing protein n=1 Tax=Stutzerimonas kirkiae TaxID=2211392 RepID=A0A4Q9R7S2_9GAMM|nr:glycosyltransferase family 2 protein [Stutzerimonas kirkiae]TBU95738.1 hypothetical protein DNJ96_11715 [Stutzerimonas kirkiae]TBV02729.1 hypothetical protein DNJ95_08615 [Stutzerimonas kirkiae]
MVGVEQGLLSICCLGYKHARYLSDNICSIRAIGYERLEVVAIDDGSADGSIELLRELAKGVPFRMEVIAQENTGNIGLNFNNAYRRSRGELVTFIALDDVYNPAVMRRQIDMMNDDPDLAFVTPSKSVGIDDNGFIKDKSPTLKLDSMDVRSVQELLELEYSEFGSFYIQGVIFRRDVIDAIGGFDEDMTGDDIVLRTKIFRYLQERSPARGFRIIRDNACFYRLHDGNVHKNPARQIRIVTEYLERFWSDRDNPRVLLDWVCSYIESYRFDEYIGFFAVNRRAASLLREERIQTQIRRSVREEFDSLRRLRRFIYERKKLGDGKRRVIILNCIRFDYSRARPATPAVHYSEYGKQ